MTASHPNGDPAHPQMPGETHHVVYRIVEGRRTRRSRSRPGKRQARGRAGVKLIPAASDL